MKKLSLAIVTLIVLVLITNMIAGKFNASFVDLGLPTGMISSLIVGIFSSQGGPLSDAADFNFKFLQNRETRVNSHGVSFKMGVPLIVCIVYTIIFAIISVVMYWDYFF
ncbi:MAG: hypothetical protein ACRCXT_14530 [Paraclostridium sp.]